MRSESDSRSNKDAARAGRLVVTVERAAESVSRASRSESNRIKNCYITIAITVGQRQGRRDGAESDEGHCKAVAWDSGAKGQLHLGASDKAAFDSKKAELTANGGRVLEDPPHERLIWPSGSQWLVDGVRRRRTLCSGILRENLVVACPFVHDPVAVIYAFIPSRVVGHKERAACPSVSGRQPRNQSSFWVPVHHASLSRARSVCCWKRRHTRPLPPTWQLPVPKAPWVSRRRRALEPCCSC